MFSLGEFRGNMLLATARGDLGFKIQKMTQLLKDSFLKKQGCQKSQA